MMIYKMDDYSKDAELKKKRKRKTEFQKVERKLEKFMHGIIDALYGWQAIDVDRAIERFSSLLRETIQKRQEED